MLDEFYAESGYKLNHQHAHEAFAKFLADEKLGCAWLIEAEEQNAGYVVMTLCYSMEYGGLVGSVDDLFVRPPFRGAGLGSAALKEVQEFCRQRGVRALRVETGWEDSRAQAVYRKSGFRPVARQLLTLPLDEPIHEN